jgi:NAD+ diphosphatase
VTGAADHRFCPACATPLALIAAQEDGGEKQRLRCPACGWTHWNNPTPVLAAVIECADREGRVLLARNAAWTNRMSAVIQYQDKVLLARNAAWQHKAYALITGFMEAGETPEDGIRREVKEETNLDVEALELIGVYDFQRMNQVIIAYHALAHGEVRLSPELVDYRLYAYDEVKCWPAGTGFALAKWLQSRGYEPKFIEWPRRD